MHSRMEASLDAEISTANSELARLLLVAKRASVRARLGKIEEARSDVLAVRNQQRGYQPLLIGRLQVAEAEIEHYSGSHDLAVDHARRAYAIGVGSGDQSLHASGAAWMATVEFIGGNVHSAVLRATECLDRRSLADPSSMGRALLVIADCWAHAGELGKAREWYAETRGVATRIGDLGLQSACLYNAAAFALASVVSADCFGEEAPLTLSTLRMQIESVRTLDALIANQALADYGPMLEAELLVVEKRWSDATSAFDGLEGLARTRPARLDGKLVASRSWCLANLGEIELAQSLAATAQSLLDDCVDLDDRAVAEARLSQVHNLLAPSSGLGAEHRERAERCRAQHHESCRDLVEKLGQLQSPSAYR